MGRTTQKSGEKSFLNFDSITSTAFTMLFAGISSLAVILNYWKCNYFRFNIRFVVSLMKIASNMG